MSFHNIIKGSVLIVDTICRHAASVRRNQAALMQMMLERRRGNRGAFETFLECFVCFYLTR